MKIQLRQYTSENAEEWNNFIAKARNTSLLFDRRFMDYHSHRFTDCSLMFMKEDELTACLPANYDQDQKCVYTHQGLTYGGLILSPRTSTQNVLDIFELALNYFREELKCKQCIYKPIPNIYYAYPSDEPLYAIFRNGGKLFSRGISSCIDLQAPIAMSKNRRYGLKLTQRNGIQTRKCTHSNELLSFWNMLNDCLRQRHDVVPVHTSEEMQLLSERFPEKIHLYASFSSEGEMLSGAWIFDCGKVAHTQYIATTEKGRRLCALDSTIATIIDDFKETHQYLDFGISTEERGTVLNEGLCHQKELYGGRGICYDSYVIPLETIE